MGSICGRIKSLDPEAVNSEVYTPREQTSMDRGKRIQLSPLVKKKGVYRNLSMQNKRWRAINWRMVPGLDILADEGCNYVSLAENWIC